MYSLESTGQIVCIVHYVQRIENGIKRLVNWPYWINTYFSVVDPPSELMLLH